MSVSGKVSSASPRVSSWHGESSKAKKIKLMGELSILFGLAFVGFGIFSTDSANANDYTVAHGSDLLPAVQLEIAPATSEIEQRSRSVQSTPLVKHSKQSLPTQPAQVKAGHLALEKRGENVYRKGGRVKAGYLLPKSEIEWFEEDFIISHYTFALESDPLYADDEKVAVPGLPDDDRFRSGFIFGGRGVLLQGTGVTEDGRYISIDWPKSYHDPEDVSNNRWVFRYGVGRPVIPWETVAVKHPDLPPGTRIVVENYIGQYEFVVGDNGLDLAENQIDIFVGTMTIAEADQLGVQRSRVGIIKPVYHYDPLANSESAGAAAEPETEAVVDG